MPIDIIDSHTEGEPTRLVVAGGPHLGSGSLAERREIFHRDFDWFRSCVVNEPRGADHIVGALLCEPSDASCLAGVIFFNNTGCLQMCGHGAMGLMVSLAHRDALKPGLYRIETPVGIVRAELHAGNRVSISNVPSYRLAKAVQVQVEGIGMVAGDIAWGGNWFFLVGEHGQQLSVARVRELTDFARRIKEALGRANITGAQGAEIDHVELFGPPVDAANHSRNFVLCPGEQYDRSPCGTGTSAKLACLHADGKLAPGQLWRQESILGTVFQARFELAQGLQEGAILPVITGSAYVTAQARLLRHPSDPLRDGVRL